MAHCTDSVIVRAQVQGERGKTMTRAVIGGVLAAVVGATIVLLLAGGDSSDPEGSTLPDPADLPAGVIAVVTEVPSSQSTVTNGELGLAMRQVAAQRGENSRSATDRELRETALSELLDRIWILGQAEEMGISVTRGEVEEEFRKVKRESFDGEADYEKFMRESHFTQDDVDERVEVQMLSERIQEQVPEDAVAPSEGEVAAYYRKHRDTQFTAGAEDGPGQVQPLAEVRAQIRSQLTEQAKQAAFAKFVRDYNRRWRSRTVCAPRVATDRCSNGEKMAEAVSPGQPPAASP